MAARPLFFVASIGPDFSGPIVAAFLHQNFTPASIPQMRGSLT